MSFETIHDKKIPKGASKLDAQAIGAIIYEALIDREPVWIISDTHWAHANIVRYAGRPMNHEMLMLGNWQDLVGEDSIVLHLGDIAFGRPEAFDEFAPYLPGRKFLIRGNHDKRKVEFYHGHGFTTVDEFDMDWEGYRYRFSHYPDTVWTKYASFHRNIHGHIHEKNMDDPRFINVSVEQLGYKPVKLTSIL